MYKIIDYSTKKNYFPISANMFSNDLLIYCNRCSSLFPNKGENKYFIVSLNVLTNQQVLYKTKHPADLMTPISHDGTIYYTHHQTTEDGIIINFAKINCINWIEQDIVSINVEKGDGERPDDYIVLPQPNLIALSDRYALFALPYTSWQKNHFYHKLLLIDSIDKQTYEIKFNFLGNDSISRLDNVWVSADSKYIIVKTGRITAGEKKAIYELNQNPEHILELLENLIMFEIDKMVNSAKSGRIISEFQLLGCADYRGTVQYIGQTDNKIVTIEESFLKSNISLKIINISTNKSSLIDINTFNHVELYCGKLFGFKKNNLLTEIYDIDQNTLLWKSDEDVIWIDEKCIITYRKKSNSNITVVIIKSIDNQKILEQFETNRIFFLKINQCLLIFKR